jgi:hypothetical protein
MGEISALAALFRRARALRDEKCGRAGFRFRGGQAGMCVGRAFSKEVAPISAVMPALVAGIHVFARKQGVDGRDIG